MHPDILTDLAEDMDVALVTGTNGKSTTARFLASALASKGPVAFNSGGSNMENGAVVALASSSKALTAVLEVDEAFLDRIVYATRPSLIVLLNLSREATRGVVLTDLTESWRTLFSEITWPCEFVANADDPIIVSTVPEGAVTHWVAEPIAWMADSVICPVCHTTLNRSDAHWSCPGCGLARPTPAWYLQGDAVRGPGATIPLSLPMPGQWPRSNALYAIAAATALSVEPTTAAEALSGIADVEGRYRIYRYNNRDVRLIMVKNAASWDAALAIASTEIPIVLAQEAFGVKDMVSMWEIDVRRLADTTVVATGQRCLDVAARLEADGIAYTLVEDPLDAIRSVPRGPVHVIANYTAFLDLRKALSAS